MQGGTVGFGQGVFGQFLTFQLCKIQNSKMDRTKNNAISAKTPVDANTPKFERSRRILLATDFHECLAKILRHPALFSSGYRETLTEPPEPVNGHLVLVNVAL